MTKIYSIKAMISTMDFVSYVMKKYQIISEKYQNIKYQNIKYQNIKYQKKCQIM